MSNCLTRRALLRTAGVALALPPLDSLALGQQNAATTNQKIKRFVCLSNNYGVYRKAFFPDPSQTGADYDMPETLQPLEKHRDKVTVFSHLDHGNTGGHQGVPVLLSGVRPRHASRFAEGNLSVDQKIAETVGSSTRFPSLTLAVNEANLISFTRTGVQIPSTDLKQTYRKLFLDESEAAKATVAEQMKRHRSILDVVHEEAKSIQRGLGRQDQQKFSEYLEAVRSVEKKIQQQQPWLNRPKPQSPIDEPIVTRQTETDLHTMMELIALAIQTDSTRAITLSSGFRNGDFGLSGGYHGFSHHGQREKEVAALKRIERNQIEQMAYLMQLLESKEDELNGGSLLDHTTVLFGCGMATGEHSTKSLPLVLAGGSFHHGDHRVYPDDYGKVPAANLLLSILQHHGIDVDQFGTSTGRLTGLEWS